MNFFILLNSIHLLCTVLCLHFWTDEITDIVTSEGLDVQFCLHCYSRMRFVTRKYCLGFNTSISQNFQAVCIGD